MPLGTCNGSSDNVKLRLIESIQSKLSVIYCALVSWVHWLVNRWGCTGRPLTSPDTTKQFSGQTGTVSLLSCSQSCQTTQGESCVIGFACNVLSCWAQCTAPVLQHEHSYITRGRHKQVETLLPSAHRSHVINHAGNCHLHPKQPNQRPNMEPQICPLSNREIAVKLDNEIGSSEIAGDQESARDACKRLEIPIMKRE